MTNLDKSAQSTPRPSSTVKSLTDSNLMFERGSKVREIELGSALSLLLLALLVALNCSACGGGDAPRVEDARKELEETRFDLRPAVRSRLALAGGAHAGDGAQRFMFGDNWYGPLSGKSKPSAFIRGRIASLEVRVLQPERARFLEIEVMPEPGIDEQRLEVLLNGNRLGEVTLDEGWQRVALPLSDGLAQAGANSVEFRAAQERESISSNPKKRHSVQKRSIAVGRVQVVEDSSSSDAAIPSTPSTPSLVEEGGASGTVRLLVGYVASTALYAHPGSRLELSVRTLEPGASSQLQIRIHGRDGGPNLYNETTEIASASTVISIELEEAAGERLELELGVLAGHAEVELDRIQLIAPRSFPDLLMIVTDTLRADRILDPEGQCETPHLDELATTGVSFSRAYSHGNRTLPSHAALFSSRLPSEAGVLRNGTRIRGDLPLIAEWMRELGYRTTATVSIRSLAPAVPRRGLDRGFTRYDNELFWDMNARSTNERLRSELEEIAASDAPFFLFLHYADPHEPYRAHGSAEAHATISLGGEPEETVLTPEVVYWKREVSIPPGESALDIDGDDEFIVRLLACEGPEGELPIRLEQGALFSAGKKFRAVIENTGSEAIEVEWSLWLIDAPASAAKRQRYNYEVEHVDQALGAVFDDLKELGRFEETLIIFTSDHGEGLGDHGQESHGLTLFREEVHVPLMFKLPARNPSLASLRNHVQSMVRHIDVVPTALDLLALPALPGQRGVSLLKEASRLIVSESHHGNPSIDQYSMRDERYTLIYQPDAGSFVMYDLATDPGEQVDVFEQSGDELLEWQQALRNIGAGALEGLGTRQELDAETANMLEALGYFE